jgi:hypothetical protein
MFFGYDKSLKHHMFICILISLMITNVEIMFNYYMHVQLLIAMMDRSLRSMQVKWIRIRMSS